MNENVRTKRKNVENQNNTFKIVIAVSIAIVAIVAIIGIITNVGKSNTANGFNLNNSYSEDDLIEYKNTSKVIGKQEIPNTEYTLNLGNSYVIYSNSNEKNSFSGDYFSFLDNDVFNYTNITEKELKNRNIEVNENVHVIAVLCKKSIHTFFENNSTQIEYFYSDFANDTVPFYYSFVIVTDLSYNIKNIYELNSEFQEIQFDTFNF